MSLMNLMNPMNPMNPMNLMVYSSSHSLMGIHMGNYYFRTLDRICNGSRCRNPLHSLRIFPICGHNNSNSLRLKKCKLQIRVRDNQHKIAS